MNLFDSSKQAKQEASRDIGGEAVAETTAATAAGMSRRKALAALGAGALAAAAGAMMLPGRKAFGESVTESVYGGGEGGVTLSDDHPIVLTSIADIRSGATTPDASKLYYVTDEGREGEFSYVPADTASSDDDGTVFVSSTGARFKRHHVDAFNIKWFGAKGDNVADDSEVFQKVIDMVQLLGGGTIYVPSGKYVVTNLKVTNHNVFIRGEGHVTTQLISRHLTNPMFDVQRPIVPPATAQLSLTSFMLADLMVKNEINRTAGDYPIFFGSTLVHSKFVNVFFQNTTPGGSAYRGNGVKIIDGFEIMFDTCTWRQFQKGYGIDMPNAFYNGGNIHFLDCLWMYCGHGLLAARGPNGICNSVLLSNSKFVGWQGGQYVAQNRVRYYQTTATAAVSASQFVPVPDATKFTANEMVLVGSDGRGTSAVISSIGPGNQIRLDRPVTINSGDTVLQGTIGVHYGFRANEMKFNIGHFEGLDVGVHCSNRYGLLTLDGVHAGNSSNVVIVDDQIQYLSLSNSRFFYRDVNQLYTNWWTIIRITKLVNSNNIILLENNQLEPNDSVDMQNRLVVNQTPHQPFVRIMDIYDGIQYFSGGLGTTYHDAASQSYNRSAPSQTSSQRWTEAGADKWALNFKDNVGNLGYRLAGKSTDSLMLSGASGNVVLGAAWNEPHLQLGNYHLWVDGSGHLRIKNGAPTAANDGKRFNTNNGG